MIFRKGKKPTPIFDSYIDYSQCPSCEKDNQSYLRVYIHGFFLGPITYRANKKTAEYECHNCGFSSDFKSLERSELKTKIDNVMDEFPLWKFNIWGPLIITVFTTVFIVTQFKNIKEAIKPNTSVLDAQWRSSVMDMSKNNKLDFEVNMPINSSFGVIYLNFYDNNQFSIVGVNTDYENGHYSLTGNEITLEFEGRGDHLITKLVLERGYGKEPLLYWKSGNHMVELENTDETNIGFKILFERQDKLPFGHFSYQPELNKWRKVSEEKLSQKEVKEKVLNLLEYFSKTFAFASENEIHTIKRTPNSPFKIARNGIRLKENMEYTITFSDSLNRVQAYQLLESAFPNHIDSDDDDIFRRNSTFFRDYINNLAEL